MEKLKIEVIKEADDKHRMILEDNNRYVVVRNISDNKVQRIIFAIQDILKEK